MALIVSDQQLDLADFRAHLRDRLPEYAHPLFLRVRDGIELTATFKYTKKKLMQEGFGPAAGNDVIYFNDRQGGAFVPLDTALYDHLRNGQAR
jgi:fatty-acyl-CoA synthase